MAETASPWHNDVYWYPRCDRCGHVSASVVWMRVHRPITDQHETTELLCAGCVRDLKEDGYGLVRSDD